MGSSQRRVRATPRLRAAVRFVCLVAALVAKSGPALAEDGNALGSGVQVHGFVSQGFMASSKNNYLAESKRGSFEFTEIGINFTKELSDRFRVGLQLFSRDLGPIGNYGAQLDWAYLDYRFFDWLGIRAGRTKLPFGLYNETSDVDAARTSVLLPQSVYPITSRDFLLAQTGVELYGTVPLRQAGDLEYRAYGGTLFYDPAYEGQTAIEKPKVPYLVGGRLMWKPPLQGLQLGGSVQALQLNLDYVVPERLVSQLEAANALPAGFNGRIQAEIPAVLWVTSLEYAPHELLLAAEYGRWHTKVESSLEAVVPSSRTTSERLYGMVSYRVRPWFTPGSYYSVLFSDASDRTARGKYQHDVAVTLRFDLTDFWLLKLEGHFMHGTAAVSPALNDDRPRAELTRNWLAAFVKTTAYF